MSKELVVIAFDNMEDAKKVVDSLKAQPKQTALDLEDAAYVVKDEQGHVTVKNAMDKTVKHGAGLGGVLGLILSLFIIGPLGAIGSTLIGAVGGGVVGKLIGAGVDKHFIEDVGNELQSGTSAAFFVVGSTDAPATLAILRPFEGKVLQTTLPPDLEDAVKRAVDDESDTNLS